MDVDPMDALYALQCARAGCHGRSEVFRPANCGWQRGQIVPFDPTAPSLGCCPQCRRHEMRVVAAPSSPALPAAPKGFTKLPTS